MRTLLENNDALGFRLLGGTIHPLRRAISATYTIDSDGPIGHFLDPGASARDVVLPLVDEGLFFFISNLGTGNLTVKNASGATVATLSAGISSIFYTDGQAWVSLVPGVSYTVFGPVGPNHSIGLVPDPGPVDAGARYLRDNGQWEALISGVANAYSFVTDGMNTAIGTGSDTLRLRSSSGKITITVTNNEAVFGDNANLSVNEAAVDHDALLNFVGDEHVAHSGVSITGTGGIGGGGTIAASRSLSLDFAGLTAQAPVLADQFAFLNSGTHFRGTLTQLNGILVHNNLSGYVADEHVAHSGVSINAGVGLSGGGTITASRTLNLNINGLATLGEGLASGDEFAIYNISGTAHAKITFNTLNTTLDHDALLGFVANEHIDHSAVSITGTGNLTGGGTIAASRTLDMANMTEATIKGRAAAAGTGTPQDLSGSQVRTITGLATTDSPEFAAINLGNASDTTLTRGAAGKLDVEGHTVLTDDEEDQGPLSGGARVTVKDLGTISSGTVTPDPGDRPMQKYANNGAHTLAPGTNVGAYLLTIVNSASAGAITTSGWTKVAGDSFTTTNGHKFRCHASIDGDGSLLVVQALQ